MSRTLFENSKAALAFAGMTLLGAVMMVGTSEKNGVLSSIDEHLAAQRANITADAQAFAKEQSVSESDGKKGSGWGSEGTVFGDYNPTGTKQPSAKSIPPATPPPGNSLMTAPLAPGAIVADEVEASEGVAMITSSELTIEPK
jgi:hypothetical protein